MRRAVRSAMRVALLASLAAVPWRPLPPAAAQAPAERIPMGEGAVIVQTLAFEGGDRESVVRVREASAQGLHFEWVFMEVHTGRDTLKAKHRYLEGWTDLADAKRLRLLHDTRAPEAHPGYTMHALSRRAYRLLRTGRPDTMQVMAADREPSAAMAFGLGTGQPTPVRWRGILAPASAGTTPFPVLLNGRRVRLPALHLRGDFTARQGRWQTELWVLADSAYPLILKLVGAFREPGNVLQTTRIDLPLGIAGLDGIAGGDGVLRGSADGLLLAAVATRADEALERALAASCRVELPGIYFAFNSATLDPASDGTIAALARVLARHPDWNATLEGHTDSVGTAAANEALSVRRVEAVRARLVQVHGMGSARLGVAGHGAARPREPNATIEGRARNRRVELVRDC